MKYLKLLLLVLVFANCSKDSNSTPINTSDGSGGSLAIFALKDNYLYSVDNAKLNVFSLINTSEPTKVNEINVGFNIETLFSNDNYLFIGSRNGMYIYSIENPENPIRLAVAEHFSSCDPVVANATNSFVTLHSNNRCGNNTNVLEIYDTTEISNPVLVHRRNLSNPKGLGLYNNYLVVCDDKIKIFDIQNPVEPVLIKAIDKTCFDVIINGNDLFAIGQYGLYRYVLDPNNITNVVQKSEIIF